MNAVTGKLVAHEHESAKAEKAEAGKEVRERSARHDSTEDRNEMKKDSTSNR